MHDYPEIRPVPKTPEVPFHIPPFPETEPNEGDEPEINDEGDPTTVSVPVAPEPELKGEFVPDLDDAEKGEPDLDDNKRRLTKEKLRQRPPTVGWH